MGQYEREVRGSQKIVPELADLKLLSVPGVQLGLRTKRQWGVSAGPYAV